MYTVQYPAGLRCLWCFKNDALSDKYMRRAFVVASGKVLRSFLTLFSLAPWLPCSFTRGHRPVAHLSPCQFSVHTAPAIKRINSCTTHRIVHQVAFCNAKRSQVSGTSSNTFWRSTRTGKRRSALTQTFEAGRTSKKYVTRGRGAVCVTSFRPEIATRLMQVLPVVARRVADASIDRSSCKT